MGVAQPQGDVKSFTTSNIMHIMPGGNGASSIVGTLTSI